MHEESERPWTDRVFAEIVRVYDEREKAERLLKDAGYPASRIPSNSRTLLDFWERVRQEVRAGIIADGIWPLLAKAHEMYPGNEVFKPSHGRKKIFISYRTNAEPDKRVCDALSRHLGKLEHDVFLDRKIEVGKDWIDEIENRIRDADAMILLLTKDSCLSEMFIQEVGLAHRVAVMRQGLPRLLPVRVAFNDALPYPLSSYVGSLQYARWDDDDDTDRLLDTIERSLRNELHALSEPPPDVTELRLGLRPLPQAQIYKGIAGSTGTLATDDPFYINRAADDVGLKAIRNGPGQTISIKGSRQIGKSSLFVRLLEAAQQLGRRGAYLDFGLLNGTWDSASSFFRYFATAIAQALDLPGLGSDAWDPQSPASSCTHFVETHVLARMSGPLTIACDEVDVVLGYPFRNEFFSMLRSWHNRRAMPSLRGPNRWKSLDILLVTSTEPYLLIDRSEQSPFNVGSVLSLEDFTLEELSRLNESLGRPLQTAEEVRQIHELMGGQAYLSRRALYLMTSEGGGTTLRELHAHAHDEQGAFGDHLRMLLSKIISNVELAKAFKVVLDNRNDRAKEHEPNLMKLTSAGLLRRSDKGFVPRCGLYAKYFRERLGSHG